MSSPLYALSKFLLNVFVKNNLIIVIVNLYLKCVWLASVYNQTFYNIQRHNFSIERLKILRIQNADTKRIVQRVRYNNCYFSFIFYTILLFSMLISHLLD